MMATAPVTDEQDLPRKPRRSVIRSLSWKRASKRTKMDESEQERVFSASVDVSIDEKSYNTTTSSAHGMSDEDAEETVFDSSTASSSKKRKKAGVWKTVKRFFSRKGSKGSRSPGQPQRSVSDPNLVQRSGGRPDVAPLEQVDETPMDTHSPPKKAISHDSLLSELRSKQREDVDNEDGTSPTTQKISVVVQSTPSDIDWQASPGSTPERLLPGLNVSHDKIRVAPRHRRAPTRKGVASVRHGGRDTPDGNVIPRSRSVGARIQGNVLVKQPELEQELEQERENLRKRMEMADEQRQRQLEEEEAKRKQLEEEKQKLEQEKLEQQKREQKQLEEETLEQERLEKQKLEEERVEKQRLEQEKLEKQRLEQEKLEKQRLEQEKLEKQRLEQEKLEKQRLEQGELEKQRLEQEKLEKQKLEQEKQERLEREKLEQEKQEKLKLEQEKQDQQMREQEKLKYERLVEENRQQQEKDKVNQYNIQQTTDFSDLAESLRSSADSNESYSVETTKVEIKETTSEQKHNTSRDVIEMRSVALYQNIDIDNVNAEDPRVEINTGDLQTVNDVADSPLLEVEKETTSTNHEITGTNEVTVVEHSGEFQPMSISEDAHLENVTSNHPETAVEEKISEDNIDVTVEKDESPSLSPPPSSHSPISHPPLSRPLNSPPVSPPSNSPPFSPLSNSPPVSPPSNSPPVSPPTNSPPFSPPPLSPSSPSTQHSPVRSKRLIIETPEKVYQKPIMPEVRIEAAKEEKWDGPRGIRRNRPQSMHSRISPAVEETNRTQDDSNLGVAKLKQTFERSSRSQTISYDRRKKPEVLPKPPSKSKQSQSLERNYRFPVMASKPHEMEKFVQTSPKKQNDDVFIVLDKVSDKVVENKASVSSSLTKKAPGPKPKPLPKPQPKIKPNLTTKSADEGKENIKKPPNSPSVSNGTVKMTNSTDGRTEKESNDADLPSFFARRSIFSPEQKANNSTPSQEEKPKVKHSPFIHLKTDICAVCGSKVYQMEKFKVKDNIVHRSCIKCSVCKRLLSVGNFILSQNKIYCKPHEPHVAISLPSV